MARERPQGSFGTQRNAQDGVNVCEFAKGGLSTTELYIPGPRYVDSHVFREYRNKTGRGEYRMSDETRGVEEDKNNTVDRTNGPKSNIHMEGDRYSISTQPL